MLDVDAEEQIPVDANHERICKFGERDNETYEKLFKRIRRMIKGQESSIPSVSRT